MALFGNLGVKLRGCLCDVPRYASFLKTCAPCIWSFLLCRPFVDLLRVHRRSFPSIFMDWKLTLCQPRCAPRFTARPVPYTAEHSQMAGNNQQSSIQNRKSYIFPCKYSSANSTSSLLPIKRGTLWWSSSGSISRIGFSPLLA
jgi:hypothetical protein